MRLKSHSNTRIIHKTTIDIHNVHDLIRLINIGNPIITTLWGLANYGWGTIMVRKWSRR